MAELKVKSDDIDALIDAIKKNKDAIDISVSSIKDPSQSKGIMLSEYINRIKNISDLLGKYKQLLDKDISDIRNSKETINEMDKQMERLSKTI